MLGVVGYKHQFFSQGVGGDLGVEFAYRCALIAQLGFELSVNVGSST
jgi:hypothetical protein